MKKIVLAGGCFWGVQRYFSLTKGVTEAYTGYAQSTLEAPKYEDVLSGTTGAVEAVEIFYNEDEIDLHKILELLFRIIDPTSLNKQGNDRGLQYRVGLYYSNEEDKKVAQDYVDSVKDNYSKEVVFEVEELQNFERAEEYHQDYLEKNPFGYCHINLNALREEERKH